MGGLFLSILLSQENLDRHLNPSQSLLRPVSEQTRQSDGVGD